MLCPARMLDAAFTIIPRFLFAVALVADAFQAGAFVFPE
jgi:hypothetical protein